MVHHVAFLRGCAGRLVGVELIVLWEVRGMGKACTHGCVAVGKAGSHCMVWRLSEVLVLHSLLCVCQCLTKHQGCSSLGAVVSLCRLRSVWGASSAARQIMG